MDGKLLSNKLRFLSVLIVFILTTACTVKIPEHSPAFFVQNKIPFRVTLIIPDDIRERECKDPMALSFTKYACGSTLYETCVKTMGKTFVEVKTVKDISEAVQPWDRALWMEVEFKIVDLKYVTSQTPIRKVCLTIKYKVVDKDNKEIFSSEIVSEEDLFPSMLGQEQHSYMIKAFSKLINKAMLKMFEETIGAYKKGLL